MAERKPAKTAEIKKYRKPVNINIGMVIFILILIYVCFYVFAYFKDNHIKPYEVREGSLASENLYTGIIIREEQLITANASGYINYYAREGERVAVGDLVYTVDETGRLSDYISHEEEGGNTLSAKDLSELKNELTHFMHNFSPENYGDTYDFKFTIQGSVLKLANASLIESISDVNTGEFEGMVNLSYAPVTGIVMYWTDGYESLLPENITASMFNKKDYEKQQLFSNELISSQDTIYKICNNESWSVVIPVEENKATELAEEEVVKVRFMKNQEESWATVNILNNADGKTYAQLTFTNSMVSFVNDRFLEIELLLNEETGLKIPNTSIVEREFFLIPESFVTQSGETDSYGVLLETILEDGTRTTEYVEIDIYSIVDGEYYVDAGVLNSGDHIYMTDSNDVYTVSKRATLIGVYNMNKGFADFRQIEILYQNDEYAIVKSNTEYGLNVYDLIVQDASSVKVDQFIYE